MNYNLTKEESEKYRKIWDAKEELHKLIKRVSKSTKIGRQIHPEDDYLELDFGGGGLSSCLKHEHVRFCLLNKTTNQWAEFEFDRDLNMIIALTEEIKDRFKEFQTKRDKNKLNYIKAKKKFAKEIFDRPVTHIIDEKWK